MNKNSYSNTQSFENLWIDSIPDHWKSKRLKFVADVRASNVDKKINENEVPVFLCNYLDVFNNEFIDSSFNFMVASATEKEIEKFILSLDDVIITKDSETPEEIAIPAYVTEDFSNTICGYHLAQIKSNKQKILGTYLFRLFQAKNFNSYFETSANGVTRYGLGISSIKDAFILLPPIMEQKSITAFLDYKTKQIDELIENKEQLLRLLDEKRIALITQAVTKGIDPNVKMKPSGIDWLGDIPEHWEAKRLRFLLIQNFSNGIFKKREFWGLGTKIINVFDIYTENFTVDINTLDYVECSPEEKESYKIQDGDFLFVRSSLKQEGIGRSAYIDNSNEELVFECHLVKGSPNKEIIKPRFLNLFLNSLYARQKLISLANTVTMTTMDQQKFKDIFICCPDPGKQLKIIEFIKIEVNKILGLRKNILTAIDKLKEYRISLITSAVTGKIDVRNFKLENVE